MRPLSPMLPSIFFWAAERFFIRLSAGLAFTRRLVMRCGNLVTAAHNSPSGLPVSSITSITHSAGFVNEYAAVAVAVEADADIGLEFPHRTGAAFRVQRAAVPVDQEVRFR